VTSVGAFEAKTNLSALLDRVEGGECVVITKHGRPVARLVPFDAPEPVHSPDEVMEEFRRIREQSRPSGPTIREMIDAGRRL
jgi:prevent-host-death family protein